ncbi:MAG: beta-galactosidase [Chloroflexi bacterium]|nr:beta-galactosidase [Chloroflexota bacterium]
MNFPHLIYGGDYNPEQWPEDIWIEDARLMQEAGVNLVSLGIFAWSKIQPTQNEFDFDWLDRLMDLLHAHGVNVNLATPTASPPAWLVRGYPDVLPVTDTGATLWHGSRRHYCPHSISYRKHAAEIAARLAERYTNHPALKMWHVDNEYASGVTECFCDASAAAFREWLKQKYSSLDRLNESWGTTFWSQHYSDWEEIHPPRKAPAAINPSQQLDWARFNSDSWLACFDEQKAILNKFSPNLPVTTNFMGFHKPADYWKFASHEDVVSNDNYPDTFDPEWMVQSGMICDLMRSLGDRHPWILMEQSPTHVNWRQRNPTKRPGVMRLCSYQAIARGADGVMFFQWRASKAGAEKHHSGMLPHGGTDTRVWREVKALGNELPKLDSVLASQVKADVAIVLDWENWWALELDSKPSNDLKLLPQLYAYYKPLFDCNITVDFAHPESDLSRYKLVIAPNLYMVNDSTVKNINRYVENGGNLVMSFFSGIVDQNEQIRLDGYPAPFREMLGLLVEEYAPYPETLTNTIRATNGRSFECMLWSDVIHLKNAKAIASYEQDYYAGSAAITHNTFGKGNAFYVGTVPDKNGMEWLLEQVCRMADIQPISTNAPAGVELLQRVNGNSSFIFALNHSNEKVNVPIERRGSDLLTGTEINGSVALEPSGVAVIQLK